jgi:MFS family permease
MPVIATIFGTVVSGIIVDALGYFDFFIIMGGLVIVVGLVSLFTMKDAPDLIPRREEKTYWRQVTKVFNWRTVKNNRELFWIFIVMMIYFIGFNVYYSYITIYFVNYLGYTYTIAGALQGGALVLAAFMTIPTARLIDKGLLARVISIALVANTLGLLCIAFASSIVFLCIGMFLAGCGYILTLQSLTAWMKNLYPEDQRGQFEGIKQVFYVAVPMVIGPMIATPVINNWGVEKLVNNVLGMVPGPSLLLVSAAVTALAILPLIHANRLHKRRLAEKTSTKLEAL